MKLAVTPFLGTFVPEHRPPVPETLLLVIEQTVLIGGAHTAGGAFGAQTQVITITVGEAVHLFLDNVCHFANRALEQLGMLENGETDLAITIRLDNVLDDLFEVLPDGGLVGKKIVHPPNGLNLTHNSVFSFAGQPRAIMPAGACSSSAWSLSATRFRTMLSSSSTRRSLSTL